MKGLKFKYLRITFVDGREVEFFNSGIDHIETFANASEGFVVRLFYDSKDKVFKSHVDEYIYKLELIKSIEQRWEKVEKEGD